MDGRMDGWMDGQTNGRIENLPILQDFVPYWGRCPATPQLQLENRVKRGMGAADHMMPLGNWFGSGPEASCPRECRGYFAVSRRPGLGGLGQEAEARASKPGAGGYGWEGKGRRPGPEGKVEETRAESPALADQGLKAKACRSGP